MQTSVRVILYSPFTAIAKKYKERRREEIYLCAFAVLNFRKLIKCQHNKYASAKVTGEDFRGNVPAAVVLLFTGPVQTDTRAGLDYLHKANAKAVALNVWASRCVYQLLFVCLSIKNYVALPDELPSGSLRLKTSACDFLFILPPYYSQSDLKEWELVEAFPASGSRLFRRKQSFQVSAAE